jgi:hypothetical protein
MKVAQGKEAPPNLPIEGRSWLALKINVLWMKKKMVSYC